MRQIALGLLLTAGALEAFCYWGLFTTGGRHRFDEMSGMIPFFAGVLGCISAVAAAVVYFIAWKRS
jgi:hypothetical protein